MSTDTVVSHTPGPWHVDVERGAVVSADAQWVAGIASGNANARLIAAAPEMYEVLQRIAYGLEQDGRTMDGMTKAAAAALARAAIAKAEGR